ncbi:MAG: hypothetical protein AB1649_02525 [Chloroflexota bacterium]
MKHPSLLDIVLMKFFSKSPYLSLVVTSRNDDNEALHRMQIFLNGFISQVQIYKLSCELIIVEWNYPADRPRLIQALECPQINDWCTIRIISVPPEIHNRFENSDVIPLFQMIAKNVGIRRAHGRFVLATNIDILFSHELVKYLASRKLRKNRMYRIDRYDVPGSVPNSLPIDELVNWCPRNVLRVYRHLEILEVRDGAIPVRRKKRKKLAEMVSEWFSREEPILHTNACGDFTLLSREYWERVSGYPEFPLRAMKLDGLLCYAAYYTGAKEIILNDPMRIYHLDHPARGDGADVALSERQSAPCPGIQVDRIQYKELVEQMRQTRKPIIFNDEGWGLADVNLPEIIAMKRQR